MPRKFFSAVLWGQNQTGIENIRTGHLQKAVATGGSLHEVKLTSNLEVDPPVGVEKKKGNKYWKL